MFILSPPRSTETVAWWHMGNVYSLSLFYSMMIFFFIINNNTYIFFDWTLVHCTAVYVISVNELLNSLSFKNIFQNIECRSKKWIRNGQSCLFQNVYTNITNIYRKKENGNRNENTFLHRFLYLFLHLFCFVLCSSWQTPSLRGCSLFASTVRDSSPTTTTTKNLFPNISTPYPLLMYLTTYPTIYLKYNLLI